MDIGARVVVRELERAGISALPLKGTRLAQALHGDPASREVSDIDVLVRRVSLGQAVSVARSLGYFPPNDPVMRNGLPQLHFELVHPRGLPRLELHWRVHWAESAFSARMLDRSTLAAGERTPQPVDDLAALLLFYARDGFVGLRLLADVAAWWDIHGGMGDTPVLAGLLDAHGGLERYWRAAARLAGVLVGVPETRLLSYGVRDRRTQVAIRFVNWRLDGDRDQVSADVKLVDGLLTPRGGLGDFARRSIAPRRDALAYDHDVEPRGFRFATLRAVYPFKLGLRWLVRTWTVRRGRSAFGV